MELTHFQMYLITRLEYLAAGLLLFGFLTFALGLAWTATRIVEERERKPGVRALVIGSVLMLLSLFIPSKEDVALIYIVPAIVNNEDAQRIPPELTKLARRELKKLLDAPAEQ